MPHPKAGYRLKSGLRVPGVTTITGRFKDSGGLIHWGWQMGMEGKDYRDVRDSAADSGTLAHKMIELFLHDEDPEIALKYEENALAVKARRGFEAFMLWAKRTNMEVIATEESLVSEQHKFGGTPDAVIVADGKLSLGDWKTGNKLYPDHLIQLGGYKLLWEENHPQDKIMGFDMMRFSKEEADFLHAHFEQLTDAERLFLLYREAYELDKKLKKRI